VKHKIFSKENLHYNEEEDFYVCPMGQRWRKRTKAQGKPRQVTRKNSRTIMQKTVKDFRYEAFITVPKKTVASSENNIFFFWGGEYKEKIR